MLTTRVVGKKKGGVVLRVLGVLLLACGLGISKHVSLRALSKLPLRKLRATSDDYRDRAFAEPALRSNEVEFVVYGHTHDHKIEPLDAVPLADGSLNKIYSNTGTWRRVHVRAAYGTEDQEFLSWKVMTFIAFYLKAERRSSSFEVWHGALGEATT